MRIDSINRELLDALAAARPRLRDAEARERLRQWAAENITGVNDAVRAAAIAPLVAP
jgi:hypothetical protein